MFELQLVCFAKLTCFVKLTGKALKIVLEQNLSPHRDKFNCNIMNKLKKKKEKKKKPLLEK